MVFNSVYAKCAKCNVPLYSITGQDLFGAKCNCEVCDKYLEWGEIIHADGRREQTEPILKDFGIWSKV